MDFDPGAQAFPLTTTAADAMDGLPWYFQLWHAGIGERIGLDTNIESAVGDVPAEVDPDHLFSLSTLSGRYPSQARTGSRG
jgi:hypothetical protein